MPRILSTLTVVALFCIASAGMRHVDAQEFTLGFEFDACGQDFVGAPGSVMTFEGFLTLTGSQMGVGGWTQGLSVTGPGLAFDNPLIEQCDAACKEAILNSPDDLGLTILAVLPTTSFVIDPALNDQGPGIVDATLLNIGTVLPAGTIRTLKFKFDVTTPATGSETVTLEYQEDLQGPGQPVKNTVSFAGATRPVDTFESCSFTVTSDAVDDKEIFVRGDVDHGGRVNITDAINTVLFAFDGKAIPCHDAADANDDGMVDQSDVVFTLSYLFVPESSSVFPVPFPSAGEDPTDDDGLGCETGLPR